MWKRLAAVCLFVSVAECVGQCRDINVPQQVWQNQGASVIYVMKNSRPNWQTHVALLVQLQKSLRYIDVNVDLIIATDKNCTAFKNTDHFKIDGGDIWTRLQHHSHYPEAYVIDRCGKVTFHITFPWSLVKWFPFVKGAVLSTFFDKPCGACHVSPSRQPPQVDVASSGRELEEDEIKVYPKTFPTYDRQTDENGPPVEIIIKEKHRHEGSDQVYEYTEMELGNAGFHRHFHSLEDLEFMPYVSDTMLPDTRNRLILDGSDGEQSARHHFKHVGLGTQGRHVRVGRSRRHDTSSSTESTAADLDATIEEMARVCTDVNDPQQSDSTYYGKLFDDLLKAVYTPDEKLGPDRLEERERISHHYEKLNNWISYIV